MSCGGNFGKPQIAKMNSADKTFETSRASNDFGNSFTETKREIVSEIGARTAHETAKETERFVVPVVGEELTVDKRVVESGRVRIAKRVREDERTIDVPVFRETVEVERVAVNQFVAEPPGIRYEGETMIIPVLREELVVEKRLMLVEELRVTKRQTETSSPQQVTLLREEIQIERDNTGGNFNS